MQVVEAVCARLVLGALVVGVGLGTLTGQPILSEFMASNGATLADEDGEFSDWIELHNPASTPVNLGGWYLTDDAEALTRWRFPAVDLPAQGYLVVFASGKDRISDPSRLHANFSLSAGGEYLALVGADGVTVVSDFGPEFPPQEQDYSYGRTTDGGLGFFATPTPGAANGAGFIAFVEDTRFTVDRGFFEAAFEVEIATATAGAAIYTTTDGTVPSPTNGVLYTGPITVNGTTVLRAVAYRDGHEPSNVDTHTYVFVDDVVRQSSGGSAPPGWPASWGGNVVDYGMDPNVVDDPRWSGEIRSALTDLPSFSLVLNLDDLFDPATGIYANPGQDGRAWERPCSVELIYPDGTDGFQIDAGLRIRGGFSRSTSNPKHAFRLFFRSEYGAPKLRYPLFGDRGTDTFDAVDLRTFQNYSWSFQGDSQGIFVRDQLNRDLQLAMGHQGERGEFYHLYINGEYWGLFNTCERPEASYGATYYGGEPEDYDVLKVEAGPYTVNATDGTMEAWTRLYQLAQAGLAADSAYEFIQGNNPDGTRNPSYEDLVEIDNLIDYMLIILYGGNLDAPISNFLGNTRPNNWYGVRNRTDQFGGFRFFVHDAEHTLLNVNQDRTGPYPAGDSSVVYSSPQWLWQKLQANAEFRLRVADHVHRHFFNDGVLTSAAVRDRFRERTGQIDRAVIGESARWGDAKTEPPLNRNHWLSMVSSVDSNYLGRRSDIVLGQLRADGLYPTVVAPSYSQHGGPIQPGYELMMTAPAGVVYYTIDGSDPRLRGGAVSPSARLVTGAVRLESSTHVKARVLSGSTWSALTEAQFTVAHTWTDLYITEIMYHPAADVEGVDADEFEFIELKNVGGTALDLSGVRFEQGIEATFPIGTELQPGEFVVLVSNPTAFASRYPGVQFDGVYTGRLNNAGEAVVLVHAAGAPLFGLTYGDSAPWPLAADGTGFSIVPVQPNLNPDPAEPANWRASSAVDGSPGRDDPPVEVQAVWITEVLTHTDLPQLDSIEVHNPNATPVDIGSWYLTDERSAPRKFQIPSGTVLAPGGYRVFDEADFNPVPGVDPSFNLDSHGEEVFLYSADAEGNLTGFSDGFSFGGAANGVSFGRMSISTGEARYPAQTANSLGAANAGPRIGPLVINEIQYHPAPGETEFVEIKNLTGAVVQLFDPSFPTNRWRVAGLDYEFPAGSEVAAQGLALVVEGDPEAFRARHQVPSAVPVFGPFSGLLQNGGERVELLRPDAPDVGLDGAVIVPMIAVDSVRYDDQAPWPLEADGAGPSLERLDAAEFGDDPVNWRASPGASSPGLENTGNRRPQVSAGGDQVLVATVFPVRVDLVGTATDDGQPEPPGRVMMEWSQVSGPGLAVFSEGLGGVTEVMLPGAGVYALRCTADDGALRASDDLVVTVTRDTSPVTVVSRGAVWRYWDQGSLPSTQWNLAVYNDASWPMGAAQLGYGDGDETTQVSYGSNPSSKYVTTWFRRQFTATGVERIESLRLGVVRDDGVVVYLNGLEVFRSNMPVGDINASTLATSAVGGADESVFQETAVDPALLVEGANLLAVEVHQANRTSSDLGFDLELLALAFPLNVAPEVQAGPDRTGEVLVPLVLQGTVMDDGLPIPPGLLTLGWSQSAGPAPAMFSEVQRLDPTVQFPVAGTYTLLLQAGDGAATSTDTMTVTITAAAYAEWLALHFTAEELDDVEVSGPDADPDADGHSNLQEYGAGTDPGDPESVMRLMVIIDEPGGEVMRLRFTAMAGRTYTIQQSERFGVGWESVSQIGSADDDRSVEFVVPGVGAAPVRYYRVVTPMVP